MNHHDFEPPNLCLVYFVPDDFPRKILKGLSGEREWPKRWSVKDKCAARRLKSAEPVRKLLSQIAWYTMRNNTPFYAEVPRGSRSRDVYKRQEKEVPVNE